MARCDGKTLAGRECLHMKLVSAAVPSMTKPQKSPRAYFSGSALPEGQAKLLTPMQCEEHVTCIKSR